MITAVCRQRNPATGLRPWLTTFSFVFLRLFERVKEEEDGAEDFRIRFSSYEWLSIALALLRYFRYLPLDRISLSLTDFSSSRGNTDPYFSITDKFPRSQRKTKQTRRRFCKSSVFRIVETRAKFKCKSSRTRSRANGRSMEDQVFYFSKNLKAFLSISEFIWYIILAYFVVLILIWLIVHDTRRYTHIASCQFQC